MSQEEYDKIKEFLVTPGRNKQYALDEMIVLSGIPKEKHHIFNKPERGDNQLSPSLVIGNEDNEKFYDTLEQLSSIKICIKDWFIRDFYYQQYFPRTIARIIELIRAEEERAAK